ncbi:unnamed protein product [Urochloa decumbens]|uniref:Uncharacterized protein n=1 Tax=Urochloa decumbens TaxID=240449 RepID=A0ABC9B5J2_9POAL
MSSQHPHRRRGAIAPIPTVCGEDKTPAPAAGGGGGVPAAEEYPCVRRTRHRRLLAFLWRQGFEAAFGSVAGETGAFFSVPRLRQLVERGQWADAIRYLLRFLPRDSPSAEARALHLFLDTLNHLANVVAGNKDGDALAAHYSTWLRHENTMSSGAVRLQCILLNIFHAKQQLRVYWNWERVRRKASEIVDDLVYRTPELKDLVLMPGGPMKAYDVLPIGFGLRRRYCFKKQVRRPRASSLAKHFLLKRSSQASSNHFQGSHDVLNKTLNWTADAIGKTSLFQTQCSL